MKRLTIHTGKYERELAQFAANITEQCTVAQISQSTIVLSWNKSLSIVIVQTLMLLLHCIALQENPVYRYSLRLRSLADELLHTEIYDSEAHFLLKFLRTNKTIHLEGYINFRMENYIAQLDLMLYSVAKKLNLTNI